jgi:hypothetical protein
MCTLLLCTTPLAAQQGGHRQQMLREQVVQRFIGMYSQTAGLTEEQTGQLTESLQTLFEWTGQHGEHMRDLWRALEEQMRPGVAANVDSITNLMNAIAAGRREEAERMNQHEEELASFLSPVQRAQFMLHWERFQRQIDSIRGRRGGPGMGMGPGNPI